jgi:chromate reductase
MSRLRILAISGSLRSASYSSALVRAVGSMAPEGVEMVESDLVRSLPIYNTDLDHDDPPTAVVALREAIADADGVLFVTPEYNYALPGGLKNLIDWASRPFGRHCLTGKPVAVVGSSPGRRGGQAAAQYLRTILPMLGANLAGPEVLFPAINAHIDADGQLTSEEIAGQLLGVLRDLITAVEATEGVIVN